MFHSILRNVENHNAETQLLEILFMFKNLGRWSLKRRTCLVLEQPAWYQKALATGPFRRSGHRAWGRPA